MNKARLLRGLSHCCMVAAAGLFALSAYLYWQYVEDQKEAFVIEDPQRTLEGVPGGTTQELEFLIRNLSRRPIRVVGAEFS